jgi:hypothetical protein
VAGRGRRAPGLLRAARGGPGRRPRAPGAAEAARGGGPAHQLRLAERLGRPAADRGDQAALAARQHPALGGPDHGHLPAHELRLQGARHPGLPHGLPRLDRHRVQQGRWLGVRTAANGTNEGNDASYAHCLLLGQGDPFPDDAKRAAVAAFQHFELSGSGVGRWCHRDWKATACPGDAPCAWLKAGMPVYGSPTAPVSPAYPTLTRSAQEAAMKFEAIRNPDTGAIAVVSPGVFRQLDGEQWEVVKSKGLAPAEPQVVNQREWDVIRAVAYGGEEPEQARAAD